MHLKLKPQILILAGRPKGSVTTAKPNPITVRRINVVPRRSRTRCTCSCPVHTKRGARTPSMISLPFRKMAPLTIPKDLDPSYWLRTELMPCHCLYCTNMRIRQEGE